MRDILSFRLGGLEYGIDLHAVQELRPLAALDRFARDGAVINGVAVSRGVILPIVDMRLAFGGGPATGATEVIILKLSHCTLGMVIDGGTATICLPAEHIQALPNAPAYLTGVAEHAGRRLLLLDIDQLMTPIAAARAAA